MHLPIYPKVDSLLLYGCPTVSEITLDDMGKRYGFQTQKTSQSVNRMHLFWDVFDIAWWSGIDIRW